MARTISGTGGLVVNSYSAVHTLTTLTVSMWILRTNGASGVADRLIDQFNSAATGGIIILSPTDNSKLQFQFGRWTGGAITYSWPNPTLNQWVHFLLTYDASSTANDPFVYYDNSSQTVTEEAAPSGSLTTEPNDNLWIGNRMSDGLRPFLGSLAEVAIWNRVVSADERKALSQKFAPSMFPGGLVLYLPLTGRNSPEKNLAPGGFNSGTVTGTAYIDHLPIINPRRQRTFGTPSVTTYNQSVAMAAGASLSDAVAISISAAIPLTTQSGVTDGQNATLTSSASLAAIAALVPSGTAVLSPTQTFVVLSAISSQGGLAYSQAVSLAIQSIVTTQGSLTLAPALAIAAQGTVSGSSVVVINPSLALTARSALTATASIVMALQEALGVVAGSVPFGGLAYTQSLAMAVSSALAASGSTGAISLSLPLAVSSQMTQQTLLTLPASIALAGSAVFAPSGNLVQAMVSALAASASTTQGNSAAVAASVAMQARSILSTQAQQIHTNLLALGIQADQAQAATAIYTQAFGLALAAALQVDSANLGPAVIQSLFIAGEELKRAVISGELMKQALASDEHLAVSGITHETLT